MMYYDDLSVEEKKLVLQEVESEAKSMLVAYLLLIFFGMFGLHSFYLGNKKAGFWQLGLSVVGYLTLFLIVGIVPLTVVGIWVIVDLFRIPKMMENQKLRLREDKAQALARLKSATEN